MAQRAKKWISGAIQSPGSLRETAAREGALHDGIDRPWLERAEKRPGKTGRRARLAVTLRGMHRGRGR